MKTAVASALLVTALAWGATARAQTHVVDPLEHFLDTPAPGRAQRVLDDGVARLSGDFNNDGRVDFAFWQEPDFGPYVGPAYLYVGRKDGSYTASGLIFVSARSLFKPVPMETGAARLLVCERRGPDDIVAVGYALNDYTVLDLSREAPPESCAGASGTTAICREACGDDAPPPIERLDIERYRANGLQAWIGR